jgi:diguanylate cyclase (GGDEF)-like protein
MNTKVPLLAVALLSLIMLTVPPGTLYGAEDSGIRNIRRIGVLAKRGHDEASQRWTPLAGYLSRALPDERFIIVPLTFEQIRASVSDGRVDFVLVNPSLYVNLEMNHGVTAIATMKNLRQGRGYTVFGSVIFTRSGRSDIRDLTDLRGKRLMAVNEDSLGGYQMAALEMKRFGIDIEHDVSDLRFGHTHDAVVYAVRDGTADAGVVRTDTLERMADEGKIRWEDFKVLHKRVPPDDVLFEFVHSTPLYPEWPFAKTAHVSDEFAKRVALALLALPSEAPAAKAALIAGWTVPLSYRPVHQLFQKLRIGPHVQPLVGLTVMDVIRGQGPAIGAGVLVLLASVIITIYVMRTNRRLAQEVQARKKAEWLLLADRDALDAKVRERTQEIEHLHLYDPLTSFPNRLLFCDRVDQVIAWGSAQEATFGIVVFDISNLQDINDSLGHSQGDLVLSAVADRLRQHIENVEAISRLGGGRFAVYEAPLDPLVKRLADIFDRPFVLDGTQIYLFINMGAAEFLRHGEDANTLLRHAESAMYQAKHHHRQLAYYDPAQEQCTKDRLIVEGELKTAIANGGLTLVYQPKVDVSTGALRGLETLVRWTHPQYGLIAPGRFVPVAEQTGLIAPLTQWIINEALQQCRAWMDQGFRVPISVNLSTWDMQDADIVSRLLDMVETWGVPLEYIELEITETSIMLNHQEVAHRLSELHEMGATISIDDFGTGYSSLAYIKRLPVDRLKIDRSFVKDLPDNADSAAITKTIIQLAHGLSLDVVAEGIETRSTLEFLRDAGCDMAQGYYFSPPLSANEAVAHWLAGDERQQVKADFAVNCKTLDFVAPPPQS